jgi:protein O-mannosyl-transferase
VVAVYAFSLRGGFLNYDDDWLIRDNPVFRRADALRAIWTDLGAETRHRLGAEYLPVRDTLMWLEVRLVGQSPRALRAFGLALYLAAILLLRGYLRRALDPPVGEIAAWLFALHPAHVESVAWLAGQKDLAALLAVAGALLCYRRDRSVAVPALTLLAVLSKSVAVVTPVLLLLDDFLARRRPRWLIVGLSAALAAAALLFHLRVGRIVGMMAPLAGGNRLATAATMGPVWLAYLIRSFVPVGLSVQHEVTVRGAGDLVGWLAYLPLVALAALSWRAARRGQRLWLWSLAWFVVALLPTSQVLAPLQNLMADRYLLFAVLGPCVVLGMVCARVGRAMLTAGVVAIFAALTLVRAPVFADSVSLWEDATAHAPRSARAHYQLAMALRDAARPVDAEPAFRQAIALAAPGEEAGRMAANNLATLLASAGRLPEARDILRDAVARYPDDPRVLGNLAELTARMGQDEEAKALFEQALRRFPTYAPARKNYDRRYGR